MRLHSRQILILGLVAFIAAVGWLSSIGNAQSRDPAREPRVRVKVRDKASFRTSPAGASLRPAAARESASRGPSSRRVLSRPMRARLAAAAATDAFPVNRSILGLYDGTEETSTEQTRLHRLLEMPLNHLGYKVTYWDIRNGLPPLHEARKYRAVATWFDEHIPEPAAYLAWARSVADTHVRFIVMDFVGTPLDEPSLPAVNSLLTAIGLTVRSQWIETSDDLRVARQDDAMVGFERKLDGPLPGFMVYRAQRNARAHVVVDKRGEEAETASHPVVTGPGGGFAAYGFAAVYDEKAERLQWVLDPFQFLAEALGGGAGPVPDTTTLVGRRIYFSHIDGDGWNNITEIVRSNRREVFVSEIVMEDLIKPYPDLPVAIGLIAADVDLAVAGKPKSARIARELFALPQVEPGSHSYTHPYDWGAFASPEREREAAQTASTNLLRAYAQKDFDLQRETSGALDVVAALSPERKPPSIYLWSGNTRPFSAAIAATRAHGVRNLNGGDSRFDEIYPSHAYLSPLARQVDGQRQIYSANANETIYTDGWTAPFDRFKFLEETLQRTEHPRRLKPFNVYYHMYSGERPESVAAVKHHLDAARAAAVVPIHTSHYAAIADSFFDVTIAPAGPHAWRILHRGAVQTIRFDHAADVRPDYARSSGLLGHTHHAGSLYVALDPGASQPLLVLDRGERSGAHGLRAGPGQPSQSPAVHPYLIGSRWPLAGLRTDACGIDVNAQGFGPGQMSWGGLRPGTYDVRAEREGHDPVAISADADAEGHLSFVLDADAVEGLRVSIRCRP